MDHGRVRRGSSPESIADPVADLAWRIDAFASKLPNGTVTSRGQSLEIWKRANGQWKLHRQMSSHLLAPVAVSTPLPSQPVYDKPTN